MSSPAFVTFNHQGASRSLALGGHFAAPRATGFRDTPAADQLSLVAEIEAGRPWAEVVRERYGNSRPWLYRIIADPSRIAFFDSVLPAGEGPVLDIGAGWGQITRPLAARRPVVCVEPVAERMAFIRAAARQEGVHDRIACVESDYLELEFTTRFAAVCAIGVLEWAGAFQESSDPQRRQRDFLTKIRRDLAPGGALVLGIENRIGLKYLLGCPDDHIGVPHIACLPAPLAARRWHEATRHTLRSFTYTMPELTDLLRDAGFSRAEFFAAFPDYKLPSAIVPIGPDGAAVSDWFNRNAPPPEHNGYDGTPLDAAFQESLSAHYKTLAAARIAHHFVPSFFVRAT